MNEMYTQFGSAQLQEGRKPSRSCIMPKELINGIPWTPVEPMDKKCIASTKYIK
jgi:hypothetical protein